MDPVSTPVLIATSGSQSCDLRSKVCHTIYLTVASTVHFGKTGYHQTENEAVPGLSQGTLGRFLELPPYSVGLRLRPVMRHT
jgi:hypothetical protein